MSILAKLAQLVSVTDNPALVQSQARALTRQVPLMYAILLVNSLALAATHLSAPPLLSIFVPTLLGAFCSIRVIVWLRNRNRPISDAVARRLLSTTVYVAGFLGIAFSAWALSLYPYGNAYQQSHIAFYLAITSICSAFCLMHLPRAAIVVTIALLVPFSAFFMISSNSVYTAVSINMVLVVGALMYILLGNYRDFAELVASRRNMALRQAETQRLSDENHRLANFDSLTHLPNRHSFDHELEQRLARARLSGEQIAVARFDVDGFKSVNEVFGHAAGDRVLVEVARRLLALGNAATFIARIGSDEFGVILDSPVPQERLTACGDAFCGAMRRPFTLAGATLHVSASAGFAASMPEDTAEALYDRADYAAVVAKREERGGAVVFSDRHAVEINKVRAMEHALRTADFDTEIYIVFQPQFDVATNRTTGYEVLARWRSPILGEVSPAEFIPMAERSGVISKITQTVLSKALLVVDKLPRPLRLSVNLSAHDISSYMAIEAIVVMIQRHGTPCRIDFEITETAVMRDLKQANEALLSLLALGSRIALDDFGTGHSSLTHVQKLPLDRIKIDRSFVAEVGSDPTSRAIIKTTVDLCRNLGISCVFEGIETEAQLEALMALGGTVMQGYLFGRPIDETLVLAQHMGEQDRIPIAS